MNSKIKKIVNDCKDSRGLLEVNKLREGVVIENEEDIGNLFKGLRKVNSYSLELIDIQRVYQTLNQKYFGNALPDDVKVEFSRRLKTVAGRCYRVYTRKNGSVTVISGEIQIGLFYHEFYPNELLATLLHEMCHLVHVDKEHHSSAFKHHLSSVLAKIGLKKLDLVLTDKSSPIQASWCPVCHKVHIGRFSRNRKYRHTTCIDGSDQHEHLKIYNVKTLVHN